MKRKFVAYALLICAIVSVSSGCMVEGRYGGHPHGYHHHYHRGY